MYHSGERYWQWGSAHGSRGGRREISGLTPDFVVNLKAPLKKKSLKYEKRRPPPWTSKLRQRHRRKPVDRLEGKLTGKKKVRLGVWGYSNTFYEVCLVRNVTLRQINVEFSKDKGVKDNKWLGKCLYKECLKEWCMLSLDIGKLGGYGHQTNEWVATMCQIWGHSGDRYERCNS